MKTPRDTVTIGVLVLVLLSGAAFGTWDDAKGRGLIPYWQAWAELTLFIFVNGSEDTEETIYFELHGAHEDFSPEQREFRLLPREMLILSTSPYVGEWLNPCFTFGYALFRCQHGGLIYSFCAVVNLDTGTGYTVPAYHEDRGF